MNQRKRYIEGIIGETSITYKFISSHVLYHFTISWSVTFCHYDYTNDILNLAPNLRKIENGGNTKGIKQRNDHNHLTNLLVTCPKLRGYQHNQNCSQIQNDNPINISLHYICYSHECRHHHE